MTNGHERIAAERERQKSVEGWTEDHDDEHFDGELAAAADCYIRTGGTICVRPGGWPWASEWWKPSGNVNRDLEKAGALYLAEAERLERQAKMMRARAHACGLMIESEKP